ncbi:MAG TPA: hypothetical protein VME46_19985 [Acidimicrobiales bacterium]|nr:hypothetical protein [Acidimicrobiales bacterium]
MFADLPVAHTDLIVRRTIVSAAALCLAACAALFVLGQVLAAAGVVVGAGAGLLNLRLFQLSATRYTAGGKINRRPFAGSVAFRLGSITALGVVLLLLVRPMGFGLLGGVVLFQLALMGNALGELVALQRAALKGSEAADGSGDIAPGPGHA